MTIDPQFLEILACPKCRGRLREEKSRLHCAPCAVAYPIRDGVPVLVVESALTDPS